MANTGIVETDISLGVFAYTYVFAYIAFFASFIFMKDGSSKKRFIILLIICTPIYDLMKKVFQKNEIAGALTILVINVLMFCFVFYFGNSIIDLVQSFYINHIKRR